MPEQVVTWKLTLKEANRNMTALQGYLEKLRDAAQNTHGAARRDLGDEIEATELQLARF